MVKDFKVIGYMPAWKTSKLAKIRYDVLTHIIYSFAYPDDGTLDLMIPNLEKANDILNMAHANGVKVLLSVGGWDDFGSSHKGFMLNAIKDEASIDKFVNNIVEAAEDLAFDGVDINWGNLGGSSEEEKEIVAFTKKLKAKLDESNKQLTLSVLGNKKENNDIVSFEIASCNKQIVDSVDWVNVICYELREGVRATNANLKVTTKFEQAIKIPNDKAVMGIPFYINMSLMAYEDDIKKHRKPEAITDSILTCGREIYCVTYEEFVSKVEWAKKNAVGLNIWEVTQDFNDREKSLLSKVKNSIGTNEMKF